MTHMTRTPTRRDSARRASRTFTALSACVLAALLSAPATASHRNHGPSRGGPERGAGHINHVWRDGAPHHHSPAQRQYQRGYAAGKKAGWGLGYRDAQASCGGDWNSKPHVGKRKLKGRSRPFRNGFSRGYAESYAAGYRKGIRQQRRHRHSWWGW